MFEEYELVVENIVSSVRHPEKLKPLQHEVESEADKFITSGAIITVSPAKKSDDTVWFIRVVDIKCCSKKPSTDDYGHIIPPGMNFLQGNFLERVSSSKSYILFKCSKKITYFYQETILFPFVEMEETNKDFILKNENYTDLYHIENTGMLICNFHSLFYYLFFNY